MQEDRDYVVLYVGSIVVLTASPVLYGNSYSGDNGKGKRLAAGNNRAITTRCVGPHAACRTENGTHTTRCAPTEYCKRKRNL